MCVCVCVCVCARGSVESYFHFRHSADVVHKVMSERDTQKCFLQGDTSEK